MFERPFQYIVGKMRNPFKQNQIPQEKLKKKWKTAKNTFVPLGIVIKIFTGQTIVWPKTQI